MAARQPMGSGSTMLDELWPTLKAFPGQLASLPSWWGSDAPPPLQVPEPEPVPAMEPIEDYEARTARSFYSSPMPTPTPSPTPLPTLRPMLQGMPTPTPTPTPDTGAGPRITPAPTAPASSGPPGPAPIDFALHNAGRWYAGQMGPHNLAQWEAENPPLVTPTPPAPVVAGPVPINREEEDRKRLEAGLPTRSGVLPVQPGGGVPQAAKPEPIRALRLPNGKVIFTNQASMYPGASEVSRAGAGRDIRGKAAAQRMTAMLEADAGNEGGLAATADPFAFKSYGRVPSSQDMAPLVQRSADLELQRMRGRAPAYDPEFIGGSPATDETTARINDEMMMEKGGRELDKASLATALAFARLPIEQQQAQQNPQIAVAQWAMEQVADIDASIVEANAIADPQLRDRTIAELQAQKQALNQMFFGDFARPGLFNSGR